MEQESPVGTETRPRRISEAVIPPERMVYLSTVEQKREYLIQGSADNIFLSATHADLLYARNLMGEDMIYKVHDAVPGRSESIGIQARIPADRLVAMFQSHTDVADRNAILEALILELKNASTDAPAIGATEGQQPLVEAYTLHDTNQLRVVQEFLAVLTAGQMTADVEEQFGALEKYISDRLQPAGGSSQNNEQVIREQMAKQKELWRQARERRKQQAK